MEPEFRSTTCPAVPLVFRSVVCQDLHDGQQVEVPLPVDTPMTVRDIEADLQAAREQGCQEAAASAEESLRARLQEERSILARALEQFGGEKRRYFAEVESEVVKLSLAIAERVLHREAQMDPLLLAGAARVALEQVCDASEAVLRVSEEEVPRWNETLRSVSEHVTVEADDAIPPGEVMLKTRSGSVQLGMRAQLQEIERGFFELLERRPGMAA